jgi:lipoic acid synthetase
MGECWQNGHATFLIMGDRCTRNCGFCAVNHDTPTNLDADEANQVAEMVRLLKLSYAVITSVTRDDLPDRGSRHFAAMISHLKTQFPALKVEVLIPDFDGRPDLLDAIIEAGPQVLGHNIETVSRLYPRVNRPQANYERSLSVLRYVAQKGAISKTGLMVGLGEELAEIQDLFHQLAAAGVRLLTIGQYLQPLPGKTPVDRYYPPDEFVRLEEMAVSAGIPGVVAGPFVRSSYHADQLYQTAIGSRTDAPTSKEKEGYPCAI